jgi:hypothetical protein
VSATFTGGTGTGVRRVDAAPRGHRRPGLVRGASVFLLDGRMRVQGPKP